MYVIVTDPTSDEILLSRKMRDDELLEPIIYAREWAQANGVEIDETDNGYIPSCSGDVRVELRESPDNSAVIWNGASYYLKREES